MKVPKKGGAGGGVDGYGIPYTPGTPFEVCPDDTMPGVLVDYIDMGMCERAKFGEANVIETVHLAKFVYQVSEKRADGRPHLLAYKPFGIKVSLHEKASYRAHVESLMGRKLEEDEDFDPEALIGLPCVIGVTHTKSGDGTKTYANIGSIGKPMKGMAPLQPEGYVRVKDREAAVDAAKAHGFEAEDSDIPFDGALPL